MAVTHTVRIPQANRSAVVGNAPSAVAPEDRYLWLQVGVAAALGASAAMLGTWAIVATQTLQMHF